MGKIFSKRQVNIIISNNKRKAFEFIFIIIIIFTSINQIIKIKLLLCRIIK